MDQEHIDAIVDAVLDGRPADAADPFDAVMSNRTFELVQDLRQDVQQNMFNPEPEGDGEVADDEIEGNEDEEAE